jgi:hypothetical protein
MPRVSHDFFVGYAVAIGGRHEAGTQAVGTDPVLGRAVDPIRQYPLHPGTPLGVLLTEGKSGPRSSLVGRVLDIRASEAAQDRLGAAVRSTIAIEQPTTWSYCCVMVSQWIARVPPGILSRREIIGRALVGT